LLAAGALIVLLLVPHGRFWLLAPLLLIGPGYLIERAWAVALPPLVRPAVWVGASIAAITLVYLWFTTAGLRVTPTLINLAALGIGLGLLWSWRGLRTRPTLASLGLPANLALLFGLVVLLAAWSRVQHIAGLQFPPWVDSVHHALITRVVGETGHTRCAPTCQSTALCTTGATTPWPPRSCTPPGWTCRPPCSGSANCSASSR
jgi:hypothetical protein